LRLAALIPAALAVLLPASASNDPTPAVPPSPAVPSSEVSDLVQHEKMRADVEAILTELQAPGQSDDFQFQNVADRFLMLGPAVVPFLVNELERQDLATFHESAYALGHLQGPGIEEALRKAAERAGKEEESKLKRAMKASAVYALTLHHVPDAVDLMLSGKEPVGRMPWMEGVPLIQIATVVGGRDATLPTADFTVEAFVLLRSTYEDASVRTIASHWGDASHKEWFGAVLDRFGEAIDGHEYVGREARDAVLCVRVIETAYASARSKCVEMSLLPAIHALADAVK